MRLTGKRVGGAFAVLLAVGGVTAVVERAGPFCALKRHDVAVPAATAPSDQVVKAFLEAMDARDHSTVKRLTTGSLASDLSDTGLLSCVEVSALRVAEPADDYDEQGRYRQVQQVYVEYQRHRPGWQVDETRPNGKTFWSYHVGRNSSAEPWRIYSEGVG